MIFLYSLDLVLDMTTGFLKPGILRKFQLSLRLVSWPTSKIVGVSTPDLQTMQV